MSTIASPEAPEGRRIPWAARRVSDPGPPTRGARALGGVLAIGAVLAVWTALVASGRWSQILLPSPLAVWRAFVQSVTVHDGQRGLSGEFLWVHLGASLWRIVRGLAWGLVIGVPLGVMLSWWRPFGLVATPIVDFVRSLPPLGYFSLLIIWFGIEDTSKVWLLVLAAFPPITLSVAASVAAVRAERINAALVLGAGKAQLLWRVVAPSVLPDLLTGVRVAVGFTWTTIVAAETSNGLPGIGGLAWATKKELRSDVAILCVIVIGLTAVLLDAVIKAVARRAVPWQGRG